MKLARFDSGNGPRLGIVSDGILEIGRHLPAAPEHMAALIEGWVHWRHKLEGISTLPADHKREDVQLLAPVERPGKILGIGLNYADHAAESRISRSNDPIWFAKTPNTVNDPYGDIEMPRVSEQLDYEGELVAIIGRRCRNATPAEAGEAVFGYAVGNDVSVRDWQFKTSQFLLGKSFDGHAPFGPWITTADEVDEARLAISTRVNGEVRQSSSTASLILTPSDMVGYLSQVMTLEPGDIIFTGTPGGIGSARKPPVWLKRGDLVSVAIEGLGEIRNRVA